MTRNLIFSSSATPRWGRAGKGRLQNLALTFGGCGEDSKILTRDILVAFPKRGPRNGSRTYGQEGKSAIRCLFSQGWKMLTSSVCRTKKYTHHRRSPRHRYDFCSAAIFRWLLLIRPRCFLKRCCCRPATFVTAVKNKATVRLRHFHPATGGEAREL